MASKTSPTRRRSTRISAIPTEYRGTRFRSKLEANWARWLDDQKIRWAYEVQGFKMGDTFYLPDFWLPEIRTVLEIKGILEPSLDKVFQLAAAAATMDVPVLVGMAPVGEQILTAHPAPATWAWSWGDDGPDCDHGYLDGGLHLASCARCDHRWFWRVEGAYNCRVCGAWDGDHFRDWLFDFTPTVTIYPSEFTSNGGGDE